MTTTSASQNIKHVFVLMLENRSLDHMLGFSGITGTDPSRRLGVHRGSPRKGASSGSDDEMRSR